MTHSELPLAAASAIASLASSTESPMTSDEIGRDQEALCVNGDGVSSAMAALGTATGEELRRR